MSKKVLIINYFLGFGGAEKYVFEISRFAIDQGLTPIVLIPNSFDKEYYDDVFKEYGIDVLRVRLLGFTDLVKKLDFKSLYWNIIFRYFGNSYFKTIHFMNLVIADRYLRFFKHDKKNFWHITNKVQYEGCRYNFPDNFFDNFNDTLVYINKYQIKEIHDQYKVNCKEVLFRLFLYK